MKKLQMKLKLELVLHVNRLQAMTQFCQQNIKRRRSRTHASRAAQGKAQRTTSMRRTILELCEKYAYSPTHKLSLLLRSKEFFFFR